MNEKQTFTYTAPLTGVEVFGNEGGDEVQRGIQESWLTDDPYVQAEQESCTKEGNDQ